MNMAYQSYYPATYQQMAYPVQQQMPQAVQPQMPQAQPQPQQNNPIIWTQGIEGAKSYLVSPGQSVMLMDSESNVFYIKSADQSGMPLPLRIFDYTERTTEQTVPDVKSQVTSDYITREEFERRLAEILPSEKKPSVAPRKEKTT